MRPSGLVKACVNRHICNILHAIGRRQPTGLTVLTVLCTRRFIAAFLMIFLLADQSITFAFQPAQAFPAAAAIDGHLGSDSHGMEGKPCSHGCNLHSHFLGQIVVASHLASPCSDEKPLPRLSADYSPPSLELPYRPPRVSA